MSHPFKKSAKQKEACHVLNHFEHSLLFGGSRSGKTTIILRNMILRGIKQKSEHLITRLHFNDCKRAIYYKSFPDIVAMCFQGIDFHWNKQDWFVEFEAACGGTSRIWLGGISDEKRSEKILGNEYSTIFANEVSQIPYESIITLRSRLAENSGLNLRFYYDLNPVGKKHWTYQEFVQGLIPGEKTPTTLECGHLILNPNHNVANLPPAYLKLLASFPKRKRQRFLEGLFLSDVEGALWTDADVSLAKVKPMGDIIKTVISVDPSVTHSKTSDECGIVVCSLDENKEGIIEADLSGKYSTSTWAQRVVNAYHEYEANEIVAETNQGGDLVEDALKTIDPNIKVVQVKASKGKFARAEPVAALYEQGKIAHIHEMGELESQMTEWVPANTTGSPDRIDALVWGLTRLMLRENGRKVRVITV